MKKYSKYIIMVLIVLACMVSLCFIPINASKLIPTIEAQVSKDLGIKIHIEKLILRIGPFLKVKAPVMHMMYENGEKFGQVDNAKFYIPWVSLLKNNPMIDTLYANKLIIRISSDDKYLQDVLNNIQKKNIEETPNIHIKSYSIDYNNKIANDKYQIKGQALDLNRVVGYKSLKLNTKGAFSINNKKYATYDLSLLPKLNIDEYSNDFNLLNFINQIKELDFHSDIIADLKLYKNSEDTVQASGFINVDNISVLEKNDKNPKSFVYLTLWGDKASILSNIYTSSDKKVYVEGMVNNSKKPVLDLKVKTDEIKLCDLYDKLRILVDLSKLNGLKSVGGTLNANFTLKGDLNKIKSNGYMKISNASVKANGLNVEKINSEIDFSNNTINIINAIGYVNNAPIMAKGHIDKNIDVEILMNKVELKYLCPVSYGVKDGIASLVANITGTLDNITHKENLQIEKLHIVNNGFDLFMEALKIDTNKNNTAYINNVMCKTPETEALKIPSLKLLIDRDFIKIPETNIFMPNSKLTVKSEITNYSNNNITFNSILSGVINSRDINKLKTNSTRYPLQISFNGNKSVQNLLAQILFEKPTLLDEPAIFNLTSKVEKNSLRIEDMSLSSFNGKFSDDFKINQKGTKKVILTGIIEDLKEPSFKNIRLFIPQQLNINVFDTVAQIKGDLFINGKVSKPEIVGQLRIPNLYNQPLQSGSTGCTLDFNKSLVVINAPLVKVADSSMSINATAMTDFSDAINIKNVNIKSKYLNTDTLLMYKDSPLMKLLPINITGGKFYSERVLANVYGEPIYLSAFSADFNLKNQVLNLKNISSEIFNGKLAGTLDYNMKDEHFDSKIMARGVSAAPIFDVISARKDTISGTMDFDSNLKGELTSKQSLNGDIRFIVHNGRMSTLGKLEHLLYAQNVVADNMLRTSLSVVTKAITLKDTGLFKYLRGDISMSNGIANIKMMQSQGPLMSLFIKGQYSPVTDYAKLIVLGRLSDEVVSGLGAFGDFSFNKLMVMLTGEDSKYNLYPEDFDKLPQLPVKNTKEFRSVINGIIDKPSSVIQFNWVSYSQKSLRQKEVPTTNVKIPSFVDEIPG